MIRLQKSQEIPSKTPPVLSLPQMKVLLISLLLTLGLTLLSQNQACAEWYATAIYPWLSSIVAALPSLLPFSLAEVVVAGCSVGIIVFLVVSLRRIVTTPDNRRFLLAKMALNVVCAVSIVALLFMLLTGVNYHRKEFAELSGLTIEETGATYEAEELYNLGTFLISEMAETRGALGAERELYFTSPEAFSQYAHESVANIEALQEMYPFFARPLYSTPKPVLASEALSYANIAGMFFPFTVESNINIKDPLFTQPFTIAHELAHQAGFMREDEANFIAFLACQESTDPLTRYSGAYHAFVRTYNVLRKVDPALAATLWASLPEAIQSDNAYYHNFLKQYEGPLKEASTHLNDTYLKANSQKDGISAYDRMLNLLLAWHKSQEG